MIAEITIKIEVDTENHEEMINILNDMDYSSSKIILEEGTGRQLVEKEMILSTCITDINTEI